jgi:iodotyrosine deiodinase
LKDHERVALPDFHQREETEMRAAARLFLDRMKTRRSIRDFSDRAVPRDIIENAVRTAALAPSGANHQPWHFAVIGSPDVKRRVRLAAEEEERAFYAEKAGEDWLTALAPLGTDDQKPFLETAPWLIAIFAQKRGGAAEDGRTKNYYVPESVGIAVGFLIAALHHAGLGTLTHTPAPMGFLNEICSRPAVEKPYLLVVAGYPAADATVPVQALQKKPFSVVSTWL